MKEVEKEKKHKKKGKKGQEQIKESQREDEMKKSSTKSLKFVLFNKQTICFSSLMLLAISGSKKLLQFP